MPVVRVLLIVLNFHEALRGKRTNHLDSRGGVSVSCHITLFLFVVHIRNDSDRNSTGQKVCTTNKKSAISISEYPSNQLDFEANSSL